ncbi:MAG: DUF2155 domain-containing protein [Pseudomonadota bacterium]
MPLHAQQTDQGVDESRAIIPRVKIIRVPVNDSSESTETTTTDQDDAQAASTVGGAEGGIETRPLEPLAGSSSGGGIVPREDRVAATDPTVGVAQPLPFPVDPNETPRVRVVTPGSDAETTEGQSETDGEQAAANPEEETGPRWLRKRTRRFKLAPKNTEVLDTTRPAYAVPISPTKTGLKEGARLRQLDKMTGQTVTYDLIIGESRRVDRLLVALDACRSPENNASHGAMAFLKIWDTRNIGGDPDFTGWMFAESPALSALDHPRYDLWVISCTTSEAEVSEVNE